MNRAYAWLGGRTTAFALAFFISGTVLAFKGKLTTTYAVSFGTTVITMLGKSVSDNYHDRRIAQSVSAAQTASSPPPA